MPLLKMFLLPCLLTTPLLTPQEANSEVIRCSLRTHPCPLDTGHCLCTGRCSTYTGYVFCLYVSSLLADRFSNMEAI